MPDMMINFTQKWLEALDRGDLTATHQNPAGGLVRTGMRRGTDAQPEFFAEDDNQRAVCEPVIRSQIFFLQFLKVLIVHSDDERTNSTLGKDVLEDIQQLRRYEP